MIKYAKKDYKCCVTYLFASGRCSHRRRKRKGSDRIAPIVNVCVCTIAVLSLKRNVLYDKWLGRHQRNRRFSSAKPKYCTNYKRQEMI